MIARIFAAAFAAALLVSACERAANLDEQTPASAPSAAGSGGLEISTQPMANETEALPGDGAARGPETPPAVEAP